jgi:Ran GTPase-activating protein (RanGAP) involved in mRNA processing and transport
VFIVEALKTNTTLTSLNLGFNSIGNEGGKAIGESLKMNRTLTELNLGDNEIGDEGEPPAGVHQRIIENK